MPVCPPNMTPGPGMPSMPVYLSMSGLLLLVAQSKGGPYALTTDTGGSQQSVLIGNTPDASSVINVSTEGGQLQIGPA